MAVISYNKNTQGNLQLSTHFKVSEFVCKCNYGHTNVLIDTDLVTLLQNIRNSLGVAVSINSGYRCAQHNADVGGASGSYHVKGQAADIVATGKTPNQIAIAAENLNAKGIIRYSSFVHVDTRTTRYWAIDGQGPVDSFGGNGGGGGGTPNDTIKTIQRKMNELYGTGLTVDGIYGTATRSALIKGLQTEINKQTGAGIAVDGIWGSNTQAKCITLREGNSGNAVYVLQGILYCRGYIYAGFNGNYNSSVTAEVKSYQSGNGLTQDGIAGPLTFASLFSK